MLIDQLNKYKADIIAIQEVRWKGNGTLEKKECVFFTVKGKAVPLHAMEALGGRGGITPTHSRPRH
jgi:hypothetical protein